jgi:hypothetical protein
MNKIKKVAKASRNFVSRHKVAFAVIGTSAVCLALHNKSVNGWNEFVEQQGLTEEYNKFLLPEE